MPSGTKLSGCVMSSSTERIRRVRTPTPQESYLHIFGAFATEWSWWLKEEYLTEGWDGDFDSCPDDWTVRLTCENGNGGTTIHAVCHDAIMKACRKILRISRKDEKEVHPNSPVARACRTFIWRPDEADFDADTADIVLQYVVLGEHVFA